VFDHFFSADGTLGFVQELDWSELRERCDAILWEELTESV
jgi:hypothetical protein